MNNTNTPPPFFPYSPHFLLYMFPTFILISIPVRLIVRKFNWDFSQSLILFLIAAVMGVLLYYIPQPPFKPQIFSDQLLWIFIPIFVFSQIYQMDFYVFIHTLELVLVMSAVSLVIQTTILGYVLRRFFFINWSQNQSILIALTCLPIHGNDIVSVLKELAKYKHLGTVLETESVFLFGFVYMAFMLCVGIEEGIIHTAYHFILVLLRFVLGGLILGCIFGKIAAILMSFLYNVPLSALCANIAVVFFTFYLAELILNVSGTFALVCVVCFITREKHRFSSEVESYMCSFWSTIHYMSSVAIMMCTTVGMSYMVVENFSIKDIYYSCISYFIVIIVRFTSLIVTAIILKIFSKIAYETNVRCLIVLGWCNVKGSFNFLLFLILMKTRFEKPFSREFVGEMFLVTLVSYLLNSTTIRLILKLLGLSELSATRKNNMNNCMKFLTDRRICVINILKSNRYLSQANWNIVRLLTIMTHPYHLQSVDSEEDEYTLPSSVIICSDCLREVQYDITDNELEEMLKESKIRILKYKKVSIIRQFENGIINKICLEVVLHFYDRIIDGASKQNQIDITYYTERHRALKCTLKILKLLYEPPNFCPPDERSKRICFYVVMNYSYDVILAAIIVFNAVYSTLRMQHYLSSLDFVHLIFCFIFLFDFCAKVWSLSVPSLLHGFRFYYRNIWNAFDATLLMANIAIIIVYLLVPNEFFMVKFILLIAWIRLLKVFQLIQILYHRIENWILNIIDTKICFGYNLATVLVNCCDEIIDLVGQIIEAKIVRDICIKEICDERQDFTLKIEEIQKERPWIAITVKTKQAIGTSLNTMEEALNELKVSGYLDNIEYEIIFEKIFEKQKFLRNLEFVKPSPPQVIFNEVAWMANDDRVIEYLYNNVETVVFEEGDTVCREKRHSKGIYIILTGLLRLKYSPKEAVIENSARYGRLPVVDYLSHINFSNKFEDNIMSGNSIGELNLLTGRAYDCTITADSVSRTYLLRTDTIKEAMRISNDPVNGLEARMWKCSIINLVLAVVMEAPTYKSLTHEEIKFKLEKAFVPNLHCYKIFAVTEIMEDIVVIEGVAADYNTGEIFTAPMLIPRTVQKLLLSASYYFNFDEEVITKLLIIPVGEAKACEIMELEQDIAELVSAPSSRCLIHSNLKGDITKKGKSLSNRIDTRKVLTKDSDESLDQNLPKSVFHLLSQNMDTRKSTDK